MSFFESEDYYTQIDSEDDEPIQMPPKSISVRSFTGSTRFVPHEALVLTPKPSRKPRTPLPAQTTFMGRNLLRVRDVLPEELADVFKFEYFNPVQSECFHTVFGVNDNIVVGAPTASGKTTVFELAILREYATAPGRMGKVIYLSPVKALCQQILTDWTARFKSPGIKCQELTGDTDPNDIPDLARCDIIITTPEKWDSVTRRWKDHLSFMGELSLVMIDEVHLLGSDRGATLEAVISRMKNLRSSSKLAGRKASELRFIALSATIPNINDIAQWLEVKPHNVFSFGDEYRPVKVVTHVLGYAKTKNDFIFDRNLNYKLCDIIAQYGDGRPALVFCSSRKGCTQAAQQIAKDCNSTMLVRDQEHRRILGGAAATLTDRVLAECVAKGVGFHSAGMALADRAVVEKLFMDENLLVLCTTSTLSQGVNFPAHLVVIKNTQHYIQGHGYEEMEDMDVLQMIGRAGRPQFDTSATAVIMTSHANQMHWQCLIEHKQPIESTLLTQLKEHIVAEVVLGSITSMESAVSWLHSTYLWTRLRKNPQHYKMFSAKPGDVGADDKLSQEMQTACIRDVRLLAENDLLKLDESGTITPTQLGAIQAKFYVAFETMQVFNSVQPKAGMEALINVLAQAKEFSSLFLRAAEKRELNGLNKNASIVRFPYKEKVTSLVQKVSIIIQAALSGYDFGLEWGLKQDMQMVFRCVCRLCKCLVQVLMSKFVLEKKAPYTPLYNAIVLCKCLENQMWNDDPLVLKQLDKVGPAIAKSLFDNGVKTFADVESMTATALEQASGRRAPFGTTLQTNVKKAIPVLELTVETREGGTDDTRIIAIDSTVTCSQKENGTAYLLVGTSENDLLFQRTLRARGQSVSDFCTVTVKRAAKVTVVLLSDKIIGVDRVVRQFEGSPAPKDDIDLSLGMSDIMKQPPPKPKRSKPVVIKPKTIPPESVSKFFSPSQPRQKKAKVAEESSEPPILSFEKPRMPTTPVKEVRVAEKAAPASLFDGLFD